MSLHTPSRGAIDSILSGGVQTKVASENPVHWVPEHFSSEVGPVFAGPIGPHHPLQSSPMTQPMTIDDRMLLQGQRDYILQNGIGRKPFARKKLKPYRDQ
jgi:hypothetical protein